MIEYVKSWIALKTDTRAVTALEYALIAAMIAAVMVVGATQLGPSMSTAFTNPSTKV